MIYAIIQTPPGSTLERTNQIALELQKQSEEIDGVHLFHLWQVMRF
jgi:hypothetical protein